MYVHSDRIASKVSGVRVFNFFSCVVVDWLLQRSVVWIACGLSDFPGAGQILVRAAIAIHPARDGECCETLDCRLCFTPNSLLLSVVTTIYISNSRQIHRQMTTTRMTDEVAPYPVSPNLPINSPPLRPLDWYVIPNSPINSPPRQPLDWYLNPISPINSPHLRPQDWQQDKGVQEYIGKLQLQAEEQLKKVQDHERLSHSRLREQDILITELQEKLDLAEDELKERKKELGEL